VVFLRVAVGGHDEEAGSDSASDAVEDGESDVGDVAAELASLREVWEDDRDAADGFYMRILGGGWTAVHVGVVADAVGSIARGGSPVWWCWAYSWTARKRYGYARHGLEGATALAREYCRRSNYYYNVWRDQDDEYMLYSDEQLGSCPDEEEFLAWLVAQPLDSWNYRLGTALRYIVPVNPEWEED